MPVYINDTNRGLDGSAQWDFLTCNGEDLAKLT